MQSELANTDDCEYFTKKFIFFKSHFLLKVSLARYSCYS